MIKENKILHICKVYWPVKGGIQVVVEWISKGLQDCFSFTILSTSEEPIAKDLGYASLFFSRSFGEIFSLPIAPSIFVKIWSTIKSYKIIAVHYPFPLVDIAIAVAPFRLPNIVVYWHSEIVSQKVASIFIRPFTSLMLKRCSAIVVASPNMLEHSKLLSKYQHKCHVIPYASPRKSLLKSEVLAKPPSESDYFIAIARHVPYKGLDVLIKAYAKSNSNSRLVIIGSGPLLEGHQQLVADYSLEKKVEFLVNSDDQEVRRLIKGSRAYILSSTMPSEAFALVQIEAMACGRPVINTKLDSGVPWVARHDIEAITVIPGDVAGLSLAIQQFDGDDDLVDRYGFAALNRVNDVFSHEQFCRATKRLYMSLLNEEVVH